MGYLSRTGSRSSTSRNSFPAYANCESNFLANFRAHLVTAAVNAGTNRGLEIARPAAEPAMHLAHSFLHDALERSTPARVKHAHCVALGVDENNRQAVGGLNAEQQAGSCSDQAVAGKLCFPWRIDEVDDVGMNLPQRDQRPGL